MKKQTLGTITLTKKYFIKIIGQLKLQDDHDRKCSDAFKVILPDDYTSGYANHILTNQLIEILKIAMTDTENDWIGYWIYELDYGKEYTEGCVTDNGVNIPLRTASDLWDMLIKNKEYDEKL